MNVPENAARPVKFPSPGSLLPLEVGERFALECIRLAVTMNAFEEMFLRGAVSPSLSPSPLSLPFSSLCCENCLQVALEVGLERVPYLVTTEVEGHCDICVSLARRGVCWWSWWCFEA
jgi:hypothetical protein